MKGAQEWRTYAYGVYALEDAVTQNIINPRSNLSRYVIKD
jgi:hypothetical protein